MHFIIDGKPVNLRELDEFSLARLIRTTTERLEQVQEELDSVMGEKLRRKRSQ